MQSTVLLIINCYAKKIKELSNNKITAKQEQQHTKIERKGTELRGQ